MPLRGYKGCCKTIANWEMPVKFQANRITRDASPRGRGQLPSARPCPPREKQGPLERMQFAPAGPSAEVVSQAPFVFCGSGRTARPVQSEALRMDNLEPTHVCLWKRKGETRTQAVRAGLLVSTNAPPSPHQVALHTRCTQASPSLADMLQHVLESKPNDMATCTVSLIEKISLDWSRPQPQALKVPLPESTQKQLAFSSIAPRDSSLDCKNVE